MRLDRKSFTECADFLGNGLERPFIGNLIESTKDPDSHVRAWAAHAIAEMGPAGEPAIPALLTLCYAIVKWGLAIIAAWRLEESGLLPPQPCPRCETP